MKIVDLFSGAGGLTFGFYYSLSKNRFIKNKQNKIIFANEKDLYAADAYKLNYPDVVIENRSIIDLTDDRVRELIGDNEIDLVIGGPPCQSFSTIGPRIFDEKAQLYVEYLRMLKVIRPKMFLFENVKGMLSMREQIVQEDEFGNIKFDDENKPITIPGKLILDVITEQLDNLDDSAGYKIVGKAVLNVAKYGVPQNRERIVLIGVRKDLVNKCHWQYPEITHGENLLPIISIEEAISDLPVLFEGEKKDQYTGLPKNDYQRLMRRGSKKLTEHYCGIHNEKMRKIIAAVPEGEGRPYINKIVNEGKLPSFCYLTSGYNNTYGRLVANKPSTTITNNMCAPSAARCIHYKQHRELSPREGARIQSFPDWFKFSGNKTNVTKQIGNAVPPLFSLVLARQIEKTIGEM